MDLHPNPYASPEPVELPIEADYADELPVLRNIHRTFIGIALTLSAAGAGDAVVRSDPGRAMIAAIAVAGFCASAKAGDLDALIRRNISARYDS